MRRALLVMAVAALGLGGCNWFKSLGKKDNVKPPTPLVEFQATASIQKLWSTSIGDGAGKSGARMHPAISGDRLYVAGVDGHIAALDASSGRSLWSVRDSKLAWSGGPGASGDLVVVGALDGSVRGLSASDGTQRWQVKLSSEIISAPAVGDDLVVVRSLDGRLYGLNPADGSRRWAHEQSVPVLTLRGASSPLLNGNAVIDGSDSGRLISVRSTDGEPLWTQVLSSADGRTEVERLADADGQIVLDDGIVYASAYHGQVGAFYADSGRPLWNREISSFAGLAVNATTLVVSDEEGNVLAFDKQSGANLWKQDSLRYRWLSSPAIVGEYVVVGDQQGYVHWLGLSDGALAARERLGKKPIEGAPVVAGDVVYVENVDGQIGAYRTR